MIQISGNDFSYMFQSFKPEDYCQYIGIGGTTDLFKKYSKMLKECSRNVQIGGVPKPNQNQNQNQNQNLK